MAVENTVIDRLATAIEAMAEALAIDELSDARISALLARQAGTHRPSWALPPTSFEPTDVQGATILQYQVLCSLHGRPKRPGAPDVFIPVRRYDEHLELLCHPPSATTAVVVSAHGTEKTFHLREHDQTKIQLGHEFADKPITRIEFIDAHGRTVALGPRLAAH